MSCCSSTNGNQCPSRMSDGRIFTDYRTRCLLNDDIVSQLNKNNSTISSYESRLYLQRNAETIMEKNKQNASDNLLCGPCTRPFTDPGTMLPEKYVVRCDNVSCLRQEVNPMGLGDGRNY